MGAGTGRRLIPRAVWRYSEMSTVAKLATAAAAVAIVVVAGIAIMLGGRGIGLEGTNAPSPSASDPDRTPTPSVPTATASDGAVGPVPGEFTACVPANTELRGGTDEQVVVPHADGEMTIERRRGFTWAGGITSTDQRFSGTHYYSWDGDFYTLASGDPGPEAWADGHRIENDGGAWQGHSMGAGLPDGTSQVSPVLLTGEGDYEGLTAVLFAEEGACFMNFLGVVMEFPEPPDPATSE
jgi:hypothetical protein